MSCSVLSQRQVLEKIRGFLKKPFWQKAIGVLKEVLGERKFYLVGGTIRDIALKKTPIDFDLAVEGKGIAIASLFAKAVNGKFILLSSEDDEARVVKILDGRMTNFDFKGMVGGDIKIDLADRDFTINSIAFGPVNELAEATLLDPFFGLMDLKRGVIRMVSSHSLKKDPLRILRAVRFASELGFKVEEKLWQEGSHLSLRQVAKERIAYELLRTLGSNQSFLYIKRLYPIGILSQIFPSLAFFFEEKEIFSHSLRTGEKLEAILHRKRDQLNRFFQKFKEWREYLSERDVIPILKLSALFHDLAKPLTRQETGGGVHFYGHDALGSKLLFKSLREELRLSKRFSERVAKIVLYHMRLHLLATGSEEITERAMRRFWRDLGEDAFGLMAITCADGYATARRTRHLTTAIKRLINFYREEEKKKGVKRLVTGYDLIDLGLKPGPIFKQILSEIEELTLDGVIRSKEEGIEYVKKNYLR